MITALWRWLSGHRSAPEIPPLLWRATLARYGFLRVLSDDEKQRLKTLSEGFLASKQFSGTHGLELSDAMCVAIAAQACLPILELGLEAYRGWVEIIVYADEFVIPREVQDEDGIVHSFDDVVIGEAWQGGPVIISWRDVQDAQADYNVVIHEFAHKLDMQNGEADGIPALHSGISRQHWEETLLAAYDDFCQRVDGGEETRIDPYASEEPAEFFAVMSEAFFGTPDLLAAEYPELYRMFSRYYRQDPKRRPSPGN